MKTLGEDDPWLDDTAAWIERSRQLQREKDLAEKRVSAWATGGGGSGPLATWLGGEAGDLSPGGDWAQRGRRSVVSGVCSEFLAAGPQGLLFVFLALPPGKAAHVFQ